MSYPAVLTEMRKAANQWAESALMRELERQGAIERKSLGATIEAPLDFQRNPGTVIQATELQGLSLTKTEVVTAASYSIAEVTAPVTWSKKDEVSNPTETQKIALVKSVIRPIRISMIRILSLPLRPLGTSAQKVRARSSCPR